MLKWLLHAIMLVTMTRHVLLAVSTLVAVACAVPNYMICGSEPAQGLPFCDHSKPTSTRVKDLLSRMTLKEKCAQLQDNMGGDLNGGIKPGASVPSIGWGGYNWNTATTLPCTANWHSV